MYCHLLVGSGGMPRKYYTFRAEIRRVLRRGCAATAAINTRHPPRLRLLGQATCGLCSSLTYILRGIRQVLACCSHFLPEIRQIGARWRLGEINSESRWTPEVCFSRNMLRVRIEEVEWREFLTHEAGAFSPDRSSSIRAQRWRCAQQSPD